MSIIVNPTSNLNYFWNVLTNLARRKDPPSQSPRGFSRCLSTFELTSLGIGAILGAGIYVVAGQVAATMAGPSTFLSFIIAAFASILSGLAYAEFGARVPRTSGSAYAYSYVAVGEIWAYIIGWNLILEYMIGTAADASALSASLENLASGMFGNVSYIFSPIPAIIGDNRPDIVSFLLTLLVTFLLVIGVRDSTRTTLICNIVNGLIITFIIVMGSFYADPSKWKGYNNFFPFGIGGTLSGAASCFYAFVGFDIIATTGEEAADASKSIPIAIVVSLIVVLVGYLSVTAVITMMVFYYEMDTRSPLPSVFDKVGLPWAGHLISCGAVFGLTSSLIGSLFPLPRIVYSMANDGLLFSFLGKIDTRTEVPTNATIFPGVLTAFFALFFNLQDLVEMMSIGTLLAYTLVSFCIIILRYQPSLSNHMDLVTSERTHEMDTPSPIHGANSNRVEDMRSSSSSNPQNLNQSSLSLEDNPETNISAGPTIDSFIKAIVCCATICLCFLISAIVILFGYTSLRNKVWWAVLLLVLVWIVIITALVILQNLPQNMDEISFKAPFVPILPITSILFNIFLILKLSLMTWIRFSVWMSLGIKMLFYSYRNSKLNQSRHIN